MAFWFAFFMWLGTSILSALLAKPRLESARPSGLDDFQVPTATEGRAVPIIVGKVKVSGPNVAWYGDLETRPIREKVGGFLGIGGKKITKGYQYYIGLQMIISSGPIDGIDRIWMGDKVISSGEAATDRVITDLDFFGGEDKGGGIDFTLQYFSGADGQAVSTYLESQLTLVPRYVNVAYMLLNDGSGGPGYIGDAAQLRNIAFEPFWYPNSLGVTGGKERIGADDANPICFLFELLTTNDDWGVVMAGSDVLVTGTVAEGALRAVAEQVADEGLGFSMIIDRPMEATELIKEIERHVDGKFRLDLSDGRFKIVLARPESGSVTLLDESNITALLDYSRPTWTETFNQVRITYADRAKEYDRTVAIDQDLANLDITGRDRIHTMSFPGVKTATVANIIAAREMFTLGAPIARAQVEVKGQEYKLFVGDPVEFTWPDHEITLLPMRISRIKYGNDIDAKMRLDLVEDVFRLEPPGLAEPFPTAWVAPNTTAVNALDARLWEPPGQLAPATTLGNPVVVLAARNGGLHLEYDVFTDFNGGTDNFVLSNEAVGDWTPVAQLQGAELADLDGPPHYTATVVIDNIVDVLVADIVANADTTVDANNPLNIILVDDELMWYEGVTDNFDGSVDLTTVHRGAFGTIPADHSDNARVWFPTLGAGLVQAAESTIPLGSAIRCRVTPRTATGTLALGSANNIPAAVDFAPTGTIPYAPGDVVVNTEKFADDDWTKTPGVLRTTWNNRNRFSQSFDTKQEDAAVSLANLATITAEVRRVDTDAVVASTTDAVAGEFNAADFIPQTVPGTPDELDFRMTVKNVQQGRLSQEWASINFEVFGFGLDFGGDFGGQDTGGLNLGVVLDQGAAPNIITPTPPSEITNRLYQIKVFNSLLSTEDVFVKISGFDATNQSSFVFQDTMDGSIITSAEEQTQFITDLAVEGFAAASRPFTVTKIGTTIEIRGTQGSSVRFEARTSILGTSANVRSLNPPGNVEEALGTQTGIRGAYFLDWFEEALVGDVTTETLAPASNSKYANQTPSPLNVVNTQFNALTRAGQQLLDQVEVVPFSGVSANRLAASFGFFQANGATTAYDEKFAEIVATLQDSPVGGLADFFVGTIPGGDQSRTAVAMLAVQDITMREFFHDIGQSEGAGATPFQLRVKESIAPVLEGPLSQATAFAWLTDSNFGPAMTSQKLQAIINGEVFIATVLTPGGDADVIVAVESLVTSINASGQPVTATFDPFGRSTARMMVVHDTPGAFATFDAQIWGGQDTNRIEFRIID